MNELKTNSLEVYDFKPEDFKAQLQVSGCYLEMDNSLLLLESSTLKMEAGKWGVPGGKVEVNELPEEAAKRELFEETGIEIKSSCIRNIGALYIRKPDIDYVFHLFKVTLDAKPKVKLSDEHSNYLWAEAQDLKTLPLMTGGEKILSKYQTILAQKRITASVNGYLILRKSSQVLLLLRKNTGYLDNYWGFPAGHIEPEESATDGMIREAEEELGIFIKPENLNVIHTMHRKSNRLNMDIFFECHKWEGEIKNQEPKKCGGVAFFSSTSLPSHVIDYNVFVLNAIEKKQFYSEWGFGN